MNPEFSSMLHLLPPLVPPPIASPCAVATSGSTRAAASAAMAARNVRVAAALCSVRVRRIFHAISELGAWWLLLYLRELLVELASERGECVCVSARERRGHGLCAAPPPPLHRPALRPEHSAQLATQCLRGQDKMERRCGRPGDRRMQRDAGHARVLGVAQP
jgi:hypothetical protein